MKNFLAILAALLFAVSVQAADVYCTGTIEDWEVTKSGYLYIDGTWNNSAESQRLCGLDGSFDSVTSETCKAWVSSVVGAKMGNREVKLKYTNVASCDATSLGTWTATVKAPEYIRMY